MAACKECNLFVKQLAYNDEESGQTCTAIYIPCVNGFLKHGLVYGFGLGLDVAYWR